MELKLTLKLQDKEIELTKEEFDELKNFFRSLDPPSYPYWYYNPLTVTNDDPCLTKYGDGTGSPVPPTDVEITCFNKGEDNVG